MITNGFTCAAVLLFMAEVLVTLEKSAKGALAKFFRFIPAVVLCSEDPIIGGSLFNEKDITVSDAPGLGIMGIEKITYID